MTRIVGGVSGGRRLAVPAGSTTRPTSERAREALFSALVAARRASGSGVSGAGGGGLTGVRFLDLYAGSGAVGLEASSRGAATVRLVEKDARAAATARANAAALGALAPGGSGADPMVGVTVTTASVERMAGQRCPDRPYDIAFLDPPYATDSGRVRSVLASLGTNGWIGPGAVIVVERSSHDPDWEWPEGFVADRCRRYGDATLWYGHAADESHDLGGEE